MRVQIISDLHREFGVSDLSFDNADLVILAGDIDIGTRGIEWIMSEIQETPVIYVLGNHEYYKGSYPKTLNKIRELSKDSNVNVLENKSITIEDITIHGTTLWTDFSLFGNPLEYGSVCQAKVNDYKKIRRDPSYSKLRSIDVYQIHNKSIKWLESNLASSESGTNIVVTHHAPSIMSIPSQFKDDPLSSAYASNLEDLITKYQPEYWIHGHIHEPKNYYIGKTQIICNPHGYIDEIYNGHEKELLLNI